MLTTTYVHHHTIIHAVLRHPRRRAPTKTDSKADRVDFCRPSAASSATAVPPQYSRAPLVTPAQKKVGVVAPTPRPKKGQSGELAGAEGGRECATGQAATR